MSEKKKRLRFLMLEDSEDDAELIIRKLRREGYRFDSKRVQDEREFKRALEAEQWDLIISDYVLPAYSGRKALELIKKEGYDLPLILVSGKIEEETAVEMIKEGASDWVMKDNLVRLPSAVERALLDAQSEREKRKTQEELKKVANRYHMLGENISDVIWTTDENKRITFVSPSVFKLSGYSIKEILSKSLDELFIPEYYKSAINAIDHASAANKNKKFVFPETDTFEAEFICKNGAAVWTETKVSFLLGKEKKFLGFLGVTRDVSKSKRIERERLDLGAAVEQLEEGIIITDAARHIRFVNNAFCVLTGFKSQNLIGEPIDALWKVEKDHELSKRQKMAFRRARSWKGRLTRCKKDGTLYQAHILISPLKDNQGKISSYIIVERDITEDMELEEQFRRMQKMEALGTLAGGIAHDFNNILMPIIINSELLLWDTSKENPMHLQLEQILEAAYRGKDLVKQILTYSRQSHLEKKPLDMARTIEEIIRFLRASLPSSIMIKKFSEIERYPVNADAVQIQQVLMNIFKNAADAIGPDEGTIEIRVRQTDVTSDNRSFFQDLQPGPYLDISITDTGCGIDSEVAERIFDPFFTTKHPGKGTGMGLAVAQRIVKNHQGTIRFSSEPGKGTTFHVYLPKADEDLPEQDSTEEFMPGGKETILLVEDEKDVMSSMKRLLERLGYKVAEMAGSREAISILRKPEGTFDLVIADQIMPEMSGLEMAQELRRTGLDIPIILMTGSNESVSFERAKDMGIKELMMKPINPRDLARAIRKVLDGVA
jgi:two-component system cell cycle sensor histidine kinase/response regulator CckA